MRLLLASLCLSVLCFPVLGSAEDARVAALGHTRLVLEEETTSLTMFNLGNPAGMGFLPHGQRMDLQAAFSLRNRAYAFDTDAAGPANVSPFGNTLPAFTRLGRTYQSLGGGIGPLEPGSFGGYLGWLSPTVVLQIVPQAVTGDLFSPDADPAFDHWQGALSARSAWLVSPEISLGAGAGYRAVQHEGWNPPEGFPFLDQISNLGRSSSSFRSWQGEIGAAWRSQGVIDPLDHLDLGLDLSGQEQRTLNRYTDGNVFLFSPVFFPAADETLRERPWQARAIGLYGYKNALDIGLALAYQNALIYRALDSSVLPSLPEHVAEARDNVDYEMSFRVRLPMVREDDLRFGVVFNNRNLGHPYPAGRWFHYAPDGLYTEPVIETSSSSIGIGTAFVPGENSIIALEYQLGSSKSRQNRDLLSESGYTRYGFGAQYSPFDHFFLRLGMSGTQVKYGLLRLLNNSIETNRLHLGLGYESGPWAMDLTGIVSRTTYSPDGWTLLEKPTALLNVADNRDQNLQVLLALRWKLL